MEHFLIRAKQQKQKQLPKLQHCRTPQGVSLLTPAILALTLSVQVFLNSCLRLTSCLLCYLQAKKKVERGKRKRERSKMRVLHSRQG